MKNLQKSAAAFFIFLSFALLFPHNASAAVLYSQDITLTTGWNIISTPKILESFTLSAANNSTNFDIYVLDPQAPSGWSTMASIGQTLFTPLYGYFVNNKTGSEQTLTFNYLAGTTPSQRLFTRTFPVVGWYSFGAANPTYTLPAGSPNMDTDNPDTILNALVGATSDYGTVIDFTDASYSTNRDSVAVTDPWKTVNRSTDVTNATEINTLRDFRETKGYGIFIKEAGAVYNGFQDTAEPTIPTEVFNISLENSSSNPDDMTVKVEENEDSEAILALVTTLENDEDSSDVNFYDIPVAITINNYGTGASTASNIIESVVLEINGEEFEGNLAGDGAIDGPTDIVYNFDFGEGVAIAVGDEAEIKVWIIFQEQENNYDEGTTIIASIDPGEIDAQGEEDDVAVTGGTKTGALLTLSLHAFIVEVTDISSEKNEDDTTGTFSFEFTIEADGNEDVVFSKADILYTILGTDTSATSDTLTFIAGDADEAGGVFTIAEGDTATFIFDVTHNPDNDGVYRVRLESIIGNDLGDDEIAGPQSLVAA